MPVTKRIKTALVALSLVLVTLAVVSGLALLSMNRSVSLESSPESLDELVSSWSNLDPIPGTILHIEEKGRLIYSGASGHRRRDGGNSLEATDPFHIASIGKLFTSAVILRLHERGHLDLDAPMSRYLKPSITKDLLVIDGRDYTGRITVRHLLTHRSGLGNTDDNLAFTLTLLLRPGKVWKPDELIALARNLDPAGKPGEITSYSSPGYFLLGKVIENVTGQPYHQVVRREIFERLGMKNTFDSVHEWKEQAPVLHHYAGWFDMTGHHPSFEFADGGFVSTAPDLAIFGRAMISGGLFEDPRTARLYLSAPPGVEEGAFYQGHGPWISRPKGQPEQVFHAGYWGCYLVAVPETGQVAVMAMGQSTADTWRFWSQARELVNRQSTFVAPQSAVPRGAISPLECLQ